MVIQLTLNQPLSPDQVRERLARRLPPGVTLQGKVVFRTDFTVRRSGAVGVAVKVETGPATTGVKLYGLAPGFWQRYFLRGLLQWAILGRKWSRMEKEVAEWLADPPVWAPPQVRAPPRAPQAAVRPVAVAPVAQARRPAPPQSQQSQRKP